MENRDKVVVACPKCGQKLRCEAGGVGTCPQCGAKVNFPDTEPVINVPDESRSNSSVRLTKSDNSKKTDKKEKFESRDTRIGCLFIFVCALIISVSIWGISLMGSGSRDGNRCTICGDDAIYTTSSGHGFCIIHLWDAITYDD